MSQSDEKIVETKKSSVSNPFASDKSALKESNSAKVESKPVDNTNDIVNPFAEKMSVPTEASNSENNEKPMSNQSMQNISDDKNKSDSTTKPSSTTVVNDSNLQGTMTYSQTGLNTNSSAKNTIDNNFGISNTSVNTNNNEIDEMRIKETNDQLIAEFKENTSKEVELVKQDDGNYAIKTMTPFPAGKISPEMARLYRYKLPLFRNVAVDYGTSMSVLLKDLYNPESLQDKDSKDETYGRLEYYYNHGEDFLHYVRKKLDRHYSSDNKNTLIDEIKNALFKVKTMEEISNVIPLPLQLILGLMLLRLKSICSNNKGEFGRICHENFGLISPKSRNNYMNAAKLLSYNNIEKYLTCDLTIQYKISELFKKKDKNGKPILDKDAENPILEAFLEISNGETPDNRDFDRVAAYVTFWKMFTEIYNFNFNKQRFYDLFKSSYSISKSDFNVIEKHGLKKISRKQFSINDVNFVDKYIDSIIKNYMNRDAALVTLGLKPKKHLELTQSSGKKENFSITITKMLEITKDYANKSLVITVDDYNNIQKIKEYISVIEKNFNS